VAASGLRAKHGRFRGRLGRIQPDRGIGSRRACCRRPGAAVQPGPRSQLRRAESFESRALLQGAVGDQADRLVLEVVLDDRARREVASKFAQAGSYPPQDSLARHLSPALLQAVNARAAQTKLPPAALQRMRPWFLATMFTVSELGRLGYDPEQGIDRYFQRRAARSKKQTLSLETVEQQIALFQGLSPEVEQLMLRETLEELPRLNEVMQGALQAWEKGDAPGLQRMLLETMDKPQYRKLRRRLFDDRNLAMSAQIERYLKTDLEYFVVVGSGHVIGDRGIVELLRKKRCRVVQQ
jgi:uncharacterized protein YbaP (TraB family)